MSQRMLTVLSPNQRDMARSSVRLIMMGLDSLKFSTATEVQYSLALPHTAVGARNIGI